MPPLQIFLNTGQDSITSEELIVVFALRSHHIGRLDALFRGRGLPPHFTQHVLQIAIAHGVHESRHLDDGTASEIVGQPLVVSGGAHQHHLQVGVLAHARAQQRQQEIRVDVSLVNLVHHHVADAPQGGVGLQLPQQDAHRQEEQGPATLLWRSALKSDLHRGSASLTLISLR